MTHPIPSEFHPLVREWFISRFRRPTEIQGLSWPRIIRGEHMLITAPTGSGKTLTAFLWALNQLAGGEWSCGRTRVLYVSPLKALNTDIQRNLHEPLMELRALFGEKGIPFPPIRARTRSGDTPQADRRLMLRNPPEILITTPESLNLLLSSVSGRTLLTGLKTVIMDEIHTVFGSKRGVHLITAVDRLVPLSGEFQRVAISATIRPMDEVAAFIGGYRMESGRTPGPFPRPVSEVHSRERKRYSLSIRSPQAAGPLPADDPFWAPLVEECRRIIERNRSTLIFVNNRRLAESLTFKINLASPEPLAYAHHGSLSKELRAEVESSLKCGKLRAIVATNSLELGIDIGSLDEVILIQSPPAVSSAVQRVGRAGHRVGEVSTGTFLPINDLDYIESAVLARELAEGDIEPMHAVEAPLDVLAQILISMTGVEGWDMDALYSFIRSSHPYRDLPRRHFDLVLDMLSGRYANKRVRELRARISIDRMENTVEARKGALLDVYSSGGTIPDRGYFHLRHEQTGARIGDLDEEYVWEAKIGQVLTFGTQHWRIRRITHNDVFVRPADGSKAAAPFWIGEGRNRDAYLSRRIGRFLEEADRRLEEQGFKDELKAACFLEEEAAERIIRFLKKQKTDTGSPLPHLTHVLVEHIESGPGGTPGNQVVLHTFWGGRVNRPFAMALDAAWEEKYGEKLEIFAGNDAVALLLPHPVSAEEIFSLVTPGNCDALLRRRLEGSGFFGARFREAAGRALLLTRKINERMPLWMNRLRSQKLLQSVLDLPDFPLVLETWRTCYQDEFDMGRLRSLLGSLEDGKTGLTECTTSKPSPMAGSLAWIQINRTMYAGDALRKDHHVSNLQSDLLREVARTPELRPSLSPEVIADFTQKRQRLAPGYPPSSPRDMVDWVKERSLIPQPDWEALCAAALTEGFFSDEDLADISDRLARFTLPGASSALIAAREDLPRIIRAFAAGREWKDWGLSDLGGGLISSLPRDRAPADIRTAEEIKTGLLLDWIQFYGPLTIDRIRGYFGPWEETGPILDSLIESGSLISGRLVKGSEEEHVCDTENYETLLRMARRMARPDFDALPIEELPLFLALTGGVIRRGKDKEALYRGLERLTGFRAPASFWETEILPARTEEYRPAEMEAILKEEGLLWMGEENRRIFFLFDSDVDLLFGPLLEEEKADEAARRGSGDEVFHSFPSPAARMTFPALQDSSALSPESLTALLWKGVWEGRVSNDSMAALRRGIHHRFAPPQQSGTRISNQGRHRGPGRFRRRAGSIPGNWFLVPSAEKDLSLIEVEEQRKDLVRILLDRYGLLFRELLHRESPPFRWGTIFRALRLMELSGEILSGYFFRDIPGPQFISPPALRLLRFGLPHEEIYWMNAADPASIAGIPLEGLRGRLPKRLEGTHISFKGAQPQLISRSLGRDLTILIPPDHPDLIRHLAPLRHLLDREFRPLKRIIIHRINEEPAVDSPYLEALKEHFHTVTDISRVSLYPKIL